MTERVHGFQGPPGTAGRSTIDTIVVRGSQGNKGERGLKGEKGELGLRGPQGSHTVDLIVVRGSQGEPGPKGHVGFIGHQGQHGVRGEKGQKGDKGERGELGRPGAQGPKEIGPSGYQGPIGQGKTGPEGPQGLTGEQGGLGPKGNVGMQGPEAPNTYRGFNMQSYHDNRVQTRTNSLKRPIELTYNLPQGDHSLQFGVQLNTPDFIAHEFGAIAPNACQVKITLTFDKQERVHSCTFKRLGVAKYVQVFLPDVTTAVAKKANVRIEFDCIALEHIPINVSNCTLTDFCRGVF